MGRRDPRRQHSSRLTPRHHEPVADRSRTPLRRRRSADASAARAGLRQPHAHLRPAVRGISALDADPAGGPGRRLPPAAGTARYQPSRRRDAIDLRHRQCLHGRCARPLRRQRPRRGGRRYDRHRRRAGPAPPSPRARPARELRDTAVVGPDHGRAADDARRPDRSIRLARTGLRAARTTDRARTRARTAARPARHRSHGRDRSVRRRVGPKPLASCAACSMPGAPGSSSRAPTCTRRTVSVVTTTPCRSVAR